MSEYNQLLLNFNQKQNFSYNDFYVSKSNYFAFKLIDTWPNWEKRILNIYGETSCGKSHLAEIFLTKYKAKIFQESDIKSEFFSNLKLHENLILDGFKNNTKEELLYTLINFVDQDNKYLIINSIIPLTEMTFNLNDLCSRVNNFIFAEIKKPDDDLIFALLIKNFSDKQIKVDKKIIDFIVKRIDRSYSKISQFIYKVDELSLKKKEPINIKTIKNIL